MNFKLNNLKLWSLEIDWMINLDGLIRSLHTENEPVTENILYVVIG